MPIGQELSDTLRTLASAHRTDDVFTVPKCLRRLDQNRTIVATWTFNDVAAALDVSYDLIASVDDARSPFSSGMPKIQIRVDKWEELHATRILNVLKYIEEVIRGEYAPDGPNSLYWDGWDKEGG